MSFKPGIPEGWTTPPGEEAVGHIPSVDEPLDIVALLDHMANTIERVGHVVVHSQHPQIDVPALRRAVQKLRALGVTFD